MNVVNFWHLFNQSILVGEEAFMVQRHLGKDLVYPYSRIKRVTVRQSARNRFGSGYSLEVTDFSGGVSKIKIDGLKEQEDLILTLESQLEAYPAKFLFLDNHGLLQTGMKKLSARRS